MPIYRNIILIYILFQNKTTVLYQDVTDFEELVQLIRNGTCDSSVNPFFPIPERLNGTAATVGIHFPEVWDVGAGCHGFVITFYRMLVFYFWFMKFYFDSYVYQRQNQWCGVGPVSETPVLFGRDKIRNLELTKPLWLWSYRHETKPLTLVIKLKQIRPYKSLSKK